MVPVTDQIRNLLEKTRILILGRASGTKTDAETAWAEADHTLSQNILPHDLSIVDAWGFVNLVEEYVQ